MTTRNQVWSHNGDIANDLEWPLTAPSTHFCKFWGFSPFFQLTFSDVCKPTFSKLFHMTWLYSKKEALLGYADFLKVPPIKNEGRKTPQISKRRHCYAAKSLYLGRGWSDFDKIWHSDAGCSSTRLTVLTVEKLKFWKSKLWIDKHKSFNIDEHLTEQHWQPVFLFSKPSVSMFVFIHRIVTVKTAQDGRLGIDTLIANILVLN